MPGSLFRLSLEAFCCRALDTRFVPGLTGESAGFISQSSWEDGVVMVSFSCDQCQDVFKKPKIEAHMWQCRASSVSCVDCGQTFGIGNVKAHTTCYTEQEKYDGSRRGHNGVGSGRGGGDRNPTYCSICQLAINGAVMAEQHYTSKKHKASLRRIKNGILTHQTSQGSYPGS